MGIDWAVGWLLLWRPSTRRSASGEDVAGVGATQPRVSVVIPARNEEDRLRLLLDDLAAQVVVPARW